MTLTESVKEWSMDSLLEDASAAQKQLSMGVYIKRSSDNTSL